MGIDFIAAKAKRFKHRTDAAFEEQLASGDLLTRHRESAVPEYRCDCHTAKPPEVGTLVVLYKAKDEIKVFNHNDKVVGTVMSPDAAELSDLMNGHNIAMLAAAVTNVQPLSNVFLIRLVSPV